MAELESTDSAAIKNGEEVIVIKQEYPIPPKKIINNQISTNTTIKPSPEVNGKTKTIIMNPSKKQMFNEFTDNVTHGKAVVTASNENETILSDDENKVLTTLEPAKKSISNKNVIPLLSIQLDQISKEDISEKAKKQLESLGKKERKIKKPAIETSKDGVEVKHVVLINNKDKVIDINHESNRKVKENKETEVPSISKPVQKISPQISLKSQILSTDELEKEIVNNLKKKEQQSEGSLLLKKMQNKLAKKIELISKIPTSKSDDKSSGTIEIPQELILSNDITSTIAPSSSTNITKVQLQNQDLIAILEGKMEEEAEKSTGIKHETYQANELLDNGDDAINIEIEIISSPKNDIDIMEEERKKEIAMRQILNLPKKPKGRKPKSKLLTETKASKSARMNIVNALVSDWSDNEGKGDEDKPFDGKEESIDEDDEEEENYETIEVIPTNEDILTVKEEKTSPVVNTVLNKDANKKSSPIVPFKRTRVVKKKIIWDPDAPETKKPFAVAAKPIQTIIPQNKKVLQVAQTSIRKISAPAKVSPVQAAPAQLQIVNKRKRSEIDKLLGDEGAINMIYSLERDNNNTEVPEIENKPNKKFLISVSKEKNNLKTKAIAIKKAVIKQSTSPNVVSSPRVRLKRETTPAKVVISPIASTSSTPALAKKIAAGKKRKATNSDWDYVYSSQEQADDSMIIRRRSNSSYSSTTSPRRLSIDQSFTTNTDSDVKGSPKKFEFIKPTDKKPVKIEPEAVKTLVADLKGKLSKAMLAKGGDSNSSNTRRSARNQSVEKTELSEISSKHEDYEEITITQHNYFVQIELLPANENLENHFTFSMMRELTSALATIKNSADCRAVLVTSAQPKKYCAGIDVTPLIQPSNDKRKTAAQECSTVVKNLLYALATFPQPLVCAVDGLCVNLGLTMLPLFDLVFASESSKFRSTYARIGQIPEGLALFSIKRSINDTFLNKLFFLSELNTAIEAQQAGFVTKVLKDKNFNEEILNHMKNISSTSRKVLQNLKQAIKNNSEDEIVKLLDDEQQILIENWISNECQDKFKNYITQKEW